MSVQCWASVVDCGQTLNRHWFIVSAGISCAAVQSKKAVAGFCRVHSKLSINFHEFCIIHGLNVRTVVSTTCSKSISVNPLISFSFILRITLGYMSNGVTSEKLTAFS